MHKENGTIVSPFLQWPLCQYTNQILRDLAHATANTQLQNNYSTLSKEVSDGHCSSPCCSVHRNRISVAKSDGCCSPKPWLRASSEPASRLRQDPAEQGALSSPAHLQQTQATWKFFMFMALITRTTWLIDSKLYYRASCFQTPNQALRNKPRGHFSLIFF